MGAVQYDGSDEVKLAVTAASTLANTSDGACSIGALVKRGAINAFHGAIFLNSGTGDGTAQAGWSFRNTNTIIWDCATATDADTAATYTSTTIAYLIIVTKAAGATGNLRAHVQAGAAATMLHADLDANASDGLDATMVQFGNWQGGDNFVGHQGVGFAFDVELSDAQCAELGADWQTSNIWNCSAGQPTLLVEQNVAPASFVDLAGNIGTITVTGTPTLDTGETLDGWTFDGTGAVGGDPEGLLIGGKLLGRGLLGGVLIN